MTCAQSNPCLTLSQAFTYGQAGDTIHIGPGTFDAANTSKTFHVVGAGSGTAEAFDESTQTRIEGGSRNGLRRAARSSSTACWGRPTTRTRRWMFRAAVDLDASAAGKVNRVTLRRSTAIARGPDVEGAVLLNRNEAGEASVMLEGSVVHSSTADQPDIVAVGSTGTATASASHSSVSDVAGLALQPGSGTNVAGDPMLAADGTPQAGSPLIDRGDTVTLPAGALDLAGTGRVQDGDGDASCAAVVDIGAFERAAAACTLPGTSGGGTGSGSGSGGSGGGGGQKTAIPVDTVDQDPAVGPRERPLTVERDRQPYRPGHGRRQRASLRRAREASRAQAGPLPRGLHRPRRRRQRRQRTAGRVPRAPRVQFRRALAAPRLQIGIEGRGFAGPGRTATFLSFIPRGT